MGDESEREFSGTAPSSAVWSALGNASRATVDEFLVEQIRLTKEQTELARLQADDLRREDAIRHWSLRVHHISDVLKLVFESALAAILAAIVIVIGVTAWSAAHEGGLVIEAFSVPPDLAAKGLTGQAIAAKLQDKLAAMQAATDSARPQASYSNNWGNDIKVQIPDTGVSIGEFYRMLVMWFGHQSHITGEVYRTKQGLAVSVRTSGDGGDTVTGTEDDLDALAQAAAEKIYAHTQAYRYGVYVTFTGRIAEGRAHFEREIARDPSTLERGWAWIGLGSIAQFSGDIPGSIGDYHRAAPLIPGFSLAQDNLDGMYLVLGHDEEALAAARDAAQLTADDRNISDAVKPVTLEGELSDVARYLGDFTDSTASVSREFSTMPE
jgi:tetratricopeptide (TPR) repeat protein